ncbi:MAG: type II toxin-antitoxin system RelE/ParE family toxin [Methylococcaceae bacterium]|nr:MAG: type II toxin-antitoxin system RelE/ParE family toxin [Methylococcaceae bacterium]
MEVLILKVQFFKSETGVEPVRKWLKDELSAEDRKTIGEDIKTLQEGFPIGMPLVRSLGDGLWELRSAISGKRITRILFCHDDDKLLLLHGFIKKRQATPKKEINIAAKRRQVASN